MYNIKEKWAANYIPWTFIVGIRTSSRAESVNSVIKRYVNSKCEISNFIKFLIEFEKKKKLLKRKKFIENNTISILLLLNLKQFIFGVIFDKHFE